MLKQLLKDIQTENPQNKALQTNIRSGKLNLNCEQKSNDDIFINKIREQQIQFKQSQDKKQSAKPSNYSVDYYVKEEDTLEGIALEYNLNPYNIMQENNLSCKTVYKNQKLVLNLKHRKSDGFDKILSPYDDDDIELSDDDVATQDVTNNAQSIKQFTTQTLSYVTSLADKTHKFQAYFYCSQSGLVQGTLSITPAVIFFDPDVFNEDNQQQIGKQRIIKFQLEIEEKDILDADLWNYVNDKDQSIQFLRISVSRNNHWAWHLKAIQENHNHEDQDDIEKIGELLFRPYIQKSYLNNPLYKKDFQTEKLQEIYQTIKDIFKLDFRRKKNFKELEKCRSAQITSKTTADKLNTPEPKKNDFLSNVSSFFQSKSKFQHQVSEKMSLQNSRGSIQSLLESEFAKLRTQSETGSFQFKRFDSLDELKFMKQLVENSKILNEAQILKLLRKIPEIYQLKEWKLLYTLSFGISLNKLYNSQDDYDSPKILIIKDFKNNVFGAFTTQSWKREKLFYGSGETFLFTFKQGEEIIAYHWTRKNTDFQHSCNDGLALGSGQYYGLYIHQELQKGYSFPSETFDNDFLTANERKDFDIDKLELWGLDELNSDSF